MTPFDLLSAVRSEVPLTDMFLLSLLDLEGSASSAHPATTRDKPAGSNHLLVFHILVSALQEGSSCFFQLFFSGGGGGGWCGIMQLLNWLNIALAVPVAPRLAQLHSLWY